MRRQKLKRIGTERNTAVPGCVWRVMDSQLSECDIRFSQSPAADTFPVIQRTYFLFFCFYLVVQSVYQAQKEDSYVL